jgi:hypothetical protein
MFYVSFTYTTGGYILKLLQCILKHSITACFEESINDLKWSLHLQTKMEKTQ